VQLGTNWWTLGESFIFLLPTAYAVDKIKNYQKNNLLKPKDFPNAWTTNDCSISMPLFHGIKDSDKDFVIEQVAELRP